MAKIKYYYDTESCRYERVRVKPTDILVHLVGFLALASVLGIGIGIIYGKTIQSKNLVEVKKENEELKLYNELIAKKSEESDRILSALRERDDNVYRLIFGAEPIPLSIREAGIGGTDRYEDILKKGLKNEALIVNTLRKVDELKRKMYIQTKSYDEIIKMAKNKEKMLAHIPAIQPVSNKQLTRISSGFGMRYHPIYKVAHFHPGIDFTAPMGTPIYATADGIVKLAKNSFAGYGNEIQINHGYGYITQYAHLSRFNVKKGQKVKRGQCIGYMGSTGLSTGPHLHYEVIHKGEKVNPVYYFYNDLSPEEYEKVLALASIENQSM
ncbi:MAG: M23 family metallopeptidase [Thermonemataceae bacterium]